MAKNANTSNSKKLFSKTIKRFGVWVRKTGLSKKIAPALAVGALVSGLATYAALTGQGGDVAPSQKEIILLLNLDLFFLLMLFVLVARHIVSLWVKRRRGGAGSKLHVRLVFLFGLLSATPTFLVASFSANFFHFGLQGWFSDKVKTAVQESLGVAESYLKEHRQLIASDALVVANVLNREWGGVAVASQEHLNKFLSDKVLDRGVDEAIVFTGKGRVLARAGLTFSLQFEQVPIWAIEQADKSGVAVLTGADDDRIRALVLLDFPDSTYLYIGRFVAEEVLAHIEKAKAAVAFYEGLEGRRSTFEITFLLLFIITSILIVMVAVWLGLILASRLATPIEALIDAAEKIRKGDLSVRVKEKAYADEISVLGRAFNRMTDKISIQTKELVSANDELDQRRRFIETVLLGVSAGVIALDKEGRVHLANRAAYEQLGVDVNEKKGQKIGTVVPEFAKAFTKIKNRPTSFYNDEIVITHTDGTNSTEKILQVRIAAEYSDDIPLYEQENAKGDDSVKISSGKKQKRKSAVKRNVTGFIFTFDDITELQKAQRQAAWADVARRIAHEIKNPLTPIQLSAERLQRKYTKQIEGKKDKDTFTECTDTIIRQVGEIGHMVTEFSSFARMPTPMFEANDIADILRKALFLQRITYKDVVFEADLPDEQVVIDCDNVQINQVFTNLLKNSVEAIKDADLSYGKGEITIRLHEESKRKPLEKEQSNNDLERIVYVIEIEDNGIGLPEDISFDKLTEPYITYKAKGTGLGLSIVQKIVEDHGGSFVLQNKESGGTIATVKFYRRNNEQQTVEKNQEAKD
ncbi:MAG: PAS domain-containing sensor histidine kinase [Alphaproteobacteria bacterium]|nr:PAS domain-containing sensor histidine kinase [Alphaproteobacteria bacterium]